MDSVLITQKAPIKVILKDNKQALNHKRTRKQTRVLCYHLPLRPTGSITSCYSRNELSSLKSLFSGEARQNPRVRGKNRTFLRPECNPRAHGKSAPHPSQKHRPLSKRVIWWTHFEGLFQKQSCQISLGRLACSAGFFFGRAICSGKRHVGNGANQRERGGSGEREEKL